MGSSYTPPGGSSSPQLPAWTYTAGAIGAGLFTTNNANPGLTNTITLASNVWGYDGTPTLQVNCLLVLTDSAGNCAVYAVSSFNLISGPALEVAVTFRGVSDSFPIPFTVGKYTVSILPGVQTAAQVGLSNVPNTDATNADNLASGTVPNARFPATLPAVSGADLTAVAKPADITLAAIQAAASVTPAADGTTASPVSITIVKGIITAIS